MTPLGRQNPSTAPQRRSRPSPTRKPRTNLRHQLLRQDHRKNLIADEFSNLPISRQRKYQLRMQRDKRCTICGQPAVEGLRCLTHLVRDREQTRKRAGYSRRYSNSISYKMQADEHQD